MNNEAEHLIEILGLHKHPEGGYFRETYRSGEFIRREELPQRYKSQHCFSTSILFLVTGNEPSRFHKILSDETWYFHKGSPLVVHVISDDGKLTEVTLGLNPDNDEYFQYTITKNNYFAAAVKDAGPYSLASCSVSPGFEFEDFTLARRDDLLKQYPHLKEHIIKLT